MRVFAPIASVAPRRVRLAAALLTLTGAASCLDLNPNVKACSVTIAPNSITISLNQASAVVATAFDCKGNSISKKTINFKSADATVATVTIGGQVIAVGVGQTTVSAVADDKSATTQVTVTPEVATQVTVNPPTATLRKGNTRQFNAVAFNAQSNPISGVSMRWTSSNSSIASVSSNGLVTALNAGSVVVSADANNVFGSAQIIITELPIGSCTLTPTSFKVTTGTSVQPQLALRDTASGALTSLGRPVVWSSENENVATVTSSGLITTRRAGTAKINASSVEFPNVTCSVTVEAVDPRIDKVIITPRTGSLRIGVPRQLLVTLLDSANGNIPPGRIVTWSTSTPTIATVSQVGIVTGLSLGTANLIARSEGVADTVSFPVTKIPVTSVTVTPLQATVFEGQTVQVTPTVTDSAGTIVTDRPIEWLTSDPTRATVSSTGLVSTIAPGQVSIFASAEGRGSQGAAITILQIPADSIATGATSVTVTRGTTTAFAITVLDASGRTLRNRNVIVTSTAPGIAIGQANTQASLVSVSGLALGSATLTLQVVNANNQNEGKPSTVTVTVIAPVP